MSCTSTPTDETELGGLPLLIPDQEGVLIGCVEIGEPRMLAAYYIHWRGHIMLGVYEDGEFAPASTFEHESQIMANQVQALTTLDAEVQLSTIGRALLKAWHIADLSSLAQKEAHVYALRELAGFSRQLTADILNVSPSTVDSHLQVAKRKRREALNLLSLDQQKAQEQQSSTHDHDSILVEVINEIDDPQRAR